jgi:DNA-binding transcriptional regulator YbjK
MGKRVALRSSDMGKAKKNRDIFDRIVTAAVTLAQTEGLAALTTRSVAVLAECSASAITYNHRSMDKLAQRVAAQCHKDLTDWRTHQFAMVQRARIPITVEGYVISVINDLTGPRRGMALLGAELLLVADFEDFQRLERQNAAFWERVLKTLGCPAEVVGTWADFTVGLISLALLDPLPPSLSSWMPMLVRRVADRIAVRPSFIETDLPRLKPVPEPPPLPSAEGARRILDATISLIAEKGVDHITHRAVAARANLSVAACTYFFSSKNDMIIAAVRELSRRIYSRTRAHLDDAPIAGVLQITGSDLHPDMKAILAVQVAAGRDPALVSVAELLLEMRGPMALERLRHDGIDVDYVDAVLWSTTVYGALHPTRIPRRGLLQHLEERTAQHRAILFGR